MLKLNKIYCMDCIEGMKQLKDNSVDLVYADIIYDDKKFLWLSELLRVIKNNASIYIQTDYRSVAELKLELDECLTYRNWIIWCYKGIARSGNKYQQNHDDILFYTVSDNYTWNNPKTPVSLYTQRRYRKLWDSINQKGEITTEDLKNVHRNLNKYKNKRTGFNLWETAERDWWIDIPVVGRGHSKETKYGKHPWQKPTKLIERIVKASSNQGDLVLDFMCGSGSTIVTCIKNKRNFIGFELNEEYVKIANARISKVQAKLF